MSQLNYCNQCGSSISSAKGNVCAVCNTVNSNNSNPSPKRKSGSNTDWTSNRVQGSNNNPDMPNVIVQTTQVNNNSGCLKALLWLVAIFVGLPIIFTIVSGVCVGIAGAMH